MAEYMEKKNNIPSPEVRHEKGDNFKCDIIVPLTIIVGGQHLIEDTTLRLTQGTKYGLVGRNGIGKTCLIDAISTGEIEGFP
jgi:ABC-type multidrug transport system ATPase subunit